MTTPDDVRGELLIQDVGVTPIVSDLQVRGERLHDVCGGAVVDADAWMRRHRSGSPRRRGSAPIIDPSLPTPKGDIHTAAAGTGLDRGRTSGLASSPHRIADA